MGVTSGRITSNTANKYKFYFDWQQASQDISRNVTTINWQIKIDRTSGTGTLGSNALKVYDVNINGNKVSSGGTWSSKTIHAGSPLTLLTGTTEIPHNGDGTKTFNANFTAWTYSQYNYSASGDFELNTIPRSATITSFNATAINETQIRLTWSADVACDYAWYSISTDNVNWSGWIDYNSTIMDITGLSPNTTYYFRLLVRRADSQQQSEAGWHASALTYDYPKVINTPDFYIGNNLYISIYNPLRRTCAFYLKLANNQQYGGDVTTGETMGPYNNADWQNTFYNSIPESQRGRYKVILVCNELGRTTETTGGEYIVRGTEKPNFNSNDWSYEANLTELTNNNQTIINGYSEITFNVETPATSDYGTTIDYYNYIWGTENTKSTIGDSVSNGTGNILNVIAVDKRGLSSLSENTSKTLEVGVNYVPYSNPTLDYSRTNVTRKNGVEQETHLSIKGSLSVDKFGVDGIDNTLYSAKYKVYDYHTQTWSGEFNIPISNFEIDGNDFRLTDFLIHANGSSGGFEIGKRYEVRVIIKDGNGILGMLESSNLSVTDGKIARDVYQDSNGDYHQGINGMANDDYTNIVHGNENITDALYIGGIKIIWKE